MFGKHGDEGGGSGLDAEFLRLARKGSTGFPAYFASALIVLLAWFGLGSIFYVVPAALADGDGDPATYVDPRTFEVVGYPIAEFAGLMLSFSMLLAGPYVAVRLVHRRPFLTLATAAGRVDYGRVAQGFVLWLVPFAALFFVGYFFDPSAFEVVFEPGRFFLFLPVALVLVPIQTSAEELLFRGYLLQGTGLLTQNAFALSVLNGLVFLVPHLPNPELPAPGDGLAFVLCSLFVFGAAMALVTLRDGGIELALGAHAANNVFAFLAVNYDEFLLDTPSIFRYSGPSAATYWDLVLSVALAATFYALAFRVFGKKGRAAREDAGSREP